MRKKTSASRAAMVRRRLNFTGRESAATPPGTLNTTEGRIAVSTKRPVTKPDSCLAMSRKNSP
jgi:hypothetical protein